MCFEVPLKGLLFMFQLAANPFDTEGAMAILEGIDLNDSCEIQLLDLSVSICITFQQ